MQSSIGIRNARAQDGERECCQTAHPYAVCDRALVGLVLWTLVHTSEALAGEPSQSMNSADKPHFAAAPAETSLSETLFTLPPTYRAAGVPDMLPFSAQDFRPRGRSLLDRDPNLDPLAEAPMMHGTTVWQRLRDFRSRDRVRVVTLWETGGSSVSLQAGKKGDPSLQWTSRAMNRGGATRGLLDEFFTMSLHDVGRGLHWGPHAAPPESPPKPLRPLDASFAGVGSVK